MAHVIEGERDAYASTRAASRSSTSDCSARRFCRSPFCVRFDNLRLAVF